MDGEISPEEVERLLEDDRPPRVVDIRPPAAFDREHIPGSENVPFAGLPDRIASLEGAERIVTVCPHGQASRQAARLIKSYEGTKDARVESMEGGLDAWEGEFETAIEADGDGGGDSDAPF
ncbi:rhodanese-like domain-containing protein [Halegenticoccus soli]|uniref:rhodanese-like domain-containing protein n=1 Tax=Halegenticoccus soli TaxID=1985678 RepID=UPI000C6C9332|nr:rhodanese-like domain-containing protein [Halegenticoccus soli]